MTHLDYIYGAVVLVARERWPLLGLSTTRRALNLLCRGYNDATTKFLSCFAGGQLRTTCEGYPMVNLQLPVDEFERRETKIEYQPISWFTTLESQHPGTLINNCSFDLWRRRYVQNTKKNSNETLVGAKGITLQILVGMRQR